MTWSSFSYTYGADTPCVLPPVLRHTLPGSCVLEIPEFGYISVSGYAMSPEKTQVSVWVVPRRGVTIRWSSRTLTVYHKASGQSEERAVLRLEPVTGAADGLVHDEYFVVYGRRLSVELVYSAVSRDVELRLPPLMVDDAVVRLLPIRVHESLRVPVPLIIPRT